MGFMEIPVLEIYSDRSTVLKHQECPRARWFGHDVPTPEGFGVSPKAWDPNLLVGAVYHEGLRGLLGGSGIEEAYGVAREFHERQLMDHGLATEGSGEGDGTTGYLQAESLALGEALIRAYEKVILPQTLARFEILSVEQEEVTPLEIPELPNFRVLFGGRTDGIFREHDSGDLFVYSAKTKKEWKPGDEDKNRYDTQGLTEWIAVESRLGKWQERLERWAPSREMPGPPPADIPTGFVERFLEGGTPTLMGVVMQFALKGRTEKKDGVWKHTSHLIRPWRKVGGGWAWKYEFQDALGGNHRLGKGWNRVNIWEALSVKEWIDHLWEENVQELGPGAGLEAAFALPADYYRNEEDRERRVRQILFQEARAREGRKKVQWLVDINRPFSEIEVVLDEFFPQHSDYPVQCGYCEFEPVCYGPRQYLLDPLAHGGFSGRVSNHPVEVEIRGKGKVKA